MQNTLTEKRATFRELHMKGCFVLPNPWDAGGARMMQNMGFKAIASTSAGYAWSTGRPDYAVTRDDVLVHLKVLCEAVQLPVNADFESGFAADAEEVAANVSLAIETGVAGISIEDRQIDDITKLFDVSQSVERIKAAKAAIAKSGHDVILVARTEALLLDSSDVTRSIDKLVALAEAGADCLYAPGVSKKTDIAAMVKAVAPKPVNVLVFGPDLSLEDLADLGVRRISVGSMIASVAWKAAIDASETLLMGTFAALANGVSGDQLNKVFGKFAA